MTSRLPVVFLVVCALAAVYGQSEEGCQTVDTPGDSSFQYAQPDVQVPVGAKGIKFSVRAANDAHIVFSPIEGDHKDMIEIVIGALGDDETQISSISLCKECEPIPMDTPDILSADEYREFSVSVKNNFVQVRVGDGAPERFQIPEDIDYTQYQYVGISTGSEGSWKFCNDWIFEQDADPQGE
ncbi:C3 and PZP-like alpha-2-macroglobulin domain-containing protein 8 [Amphiura filiformis]|uniref:C3 and PZP-like alpha-2-macroglobulin domain-containing protein 8 n=1 Tax=Amphiura filiformis TaxID=82378 RepID=UPI003B20EBB0